MLNQTGIIKESATTPSSILIAPELAFSIPVKVSNTGVVADGKGKKIIYAGTPLKGDLLSRGTTAMTAILDKESTDTASCVLLHDIDVTDGTANATGLVFGFIQYDMLASDVKPVISSAVTKMSGKITLV